MSQQADPALKDLIEFLQGHESIVIPQLDNDIAFELGLLLRHTFLQIYDPNKDGIVISISLFSGHTLFSCAVGNPAKLGPDNWDWVRRKANTVKRFGQSSYLVGRSRVLKGKDLDGLGPDYAAHGGGFPIRVKGMHAGPVGAIVVSGLAQQQDHNLIVDTLTSFIQK
ncbi:related to UPF0303 protein Ping_1243 [Melanopsichium pennsylvanicum]|uniref:Related to UPF0303 protein Ping_1243 n=2 Tax=Melanopsichium pennsylvanicum TaxID=63383 RepID=A0AAJ5C541_9BASI|nr:conserved hypothetical protein [Melanopsichium pennsylvanicum 4]SNX84178.1 related to UPF0303 protein Ping_1243 [Melanopsichium pennsylvanicum]